MISYFMNSISKEHIFCRMIRKTYRNRHQKKRKQNKISFPEITHGAGYFYKQEQEIADYQELGEVSKSTNYENLT